LRELLFKGDILEVHNFFKIFHFQAGAADKSADYHQRHHQCRQGSPHADGKGPYREPLSRFREIVANPDDIGRNHEAEAEHDTGYEAGSKQAADRRIGDHAIHDHHHGGRNHDAKRSRRSRHGRGETGRIAAIAHCRDHNSADCTRIGRGRTGYAAIDHAGAYVDRPQTTAHPAEALVGDRYDAAGKSALIHYASGKEEERNGGEGNRVRAPEDLLCKPGVRQREEAAVEDGNARPRECPCDRHPDRHKGEEDDTENK